MPVKLAVLVKFLEQFTADRHAETDHRVFHGRSPLRSRSAITSSRRY
jgi:hypothetical protein